MPRKKKNKKPLKKRSGFALAAMSRKAGLAPMKDRRTPRGGNRNKQRDILDERDEKDND
jgi:hypothetical protein